MFCVRRWSVGVGKYTTESPKQVQQKVHLYITKVIQFSHLGILFIYGAGILYTADENYLSRGKNCSLKFTLETNFKRVRTKSRKKHLQLKGYRYAQ